MSITREEFDEWKQLAVTKKLMSRIKIDVDLMKDMLTEVSLDDLKELQGRCKASQNLLNVEYEDLFE